MTRIPHAVDRHVGQRLRLRRLVCDLSQGALAKSCRITFQQVQKYEKGSNRISASRLQQIAKMLDVPVSFFFEGAPTGDMPTGGFSDSAANAYVSDFMSSSEGVQLTKAFVRIKSAKVRRRIIDLVETLAEEEPENT